MKNDKPLLRSTFLATNATHSLLCTLLGEYVRQADTRATLADLKKELGELEYGNFEQDLAKLMTNGRTAVSAVKEMITRSVERRAASVPGAIARNASEVRLPNRPRFD